MDKIQIVIYIIGGLIYLFSTVKKAAKKADDSRKNAQPYQTNPSPVKHKETSTLEEMIKSLGYNTSTEMDRKNKNELERIKNKTNGKQNIDEPNVLSNKDKGFLEAQNRIDKVLMEKQKMFDEIEKQKQRVEEESFKSYDDGIDEMVKKYEATPVYINPASNVNYENQKKVNYKGLDNGKDRFEEFAQKSEVEHPILKLLRDKQMVQKIFIANEIFNRKTGE